jgi:hypothetical protein
MDTRPDERGKDVIASPARLPRLLPREREFRRDKAGVEAPDLDMRDEPDLVLVCSRGDSASYGMETRLVELSRFESQLWPFSSRVDEASAIPVRSIHSESDLDAWVSLNGRRWDGPLCFLSWWCSGRATSLLWRFESLSMPGRVELLLRVWRVRELLREWERMGGVPGTETLERYEVRGLSVSSRGEK